MPMPFAAWRAALLPASYAGCGFKVEAGGFAGGRRLAVHEYAHLDTPYVEDLGRKARRWQITGYCIGPGYLADRDALVQACEAAGPSTFVHPSFGSQQVHCEVCNPVEAREKGGYVVFELVFVEAGQSPDASATADTQSQASSAAGASNDATAAGTDASLRGVGSDAVAGGTAGAAASPSVTAIGFDAAASARAGAASYPVTTSSGSRSIGSA